MCVDIHVHIYKRVEARGQPQVIFYSTVHLVLGWLASEFSAPQGWSCQRVHPHLAFHTGSRDQAELHKGVQQAPSTNSPLQTLLFSETGPPTAQSGTDLVMKWRMVLILNSCLSCLSHRNPGIVGTFCCVPSLCSMWFEVGALCMQNQYSPDWTTFYPPLQMGFLCRPGLYSWPVASSSQVLGWQACATMSSLWNAKPLEVFVNVYFSLYLLNEFPHLVVSVSG